MLSTRLGYFLPAFLAAALADALAAGDNGVDFFLGLGFSQTFLAIIYFPNSFHHQRQRYPKDHAFHYHREL